MPGDFREFFDLRKLDERQLAEIEFILTSPAYEHSFKPYMLGVLRSMQRLWMDRTPERKAQYPDEFLAGGATYAEGLIKFFDLLVQETSLERIHAAMESVTNEMLYDRKRQRGEMKPVVGLDQPAMPGGADPEEF